jgi:hypothetical protein
LPPYFGLDLVYFSLKTSKKKFNYLTFSLFKKFSFFPTNDLSAFHLPLALFLASLFSPQSEGACGPGHQDTRLSADLAILISDIPSKRLGK